MTMARLDFDALEEIALGATLLGTGGGGDPTLGKLMAQQAVARHGPIELVPLEDVPDEVWIVPSAMMGAPTVMIEKVPSGHEVVDAFLMLEKRLGCTAFATLSIEAGGLNSMIPMVVAATLRKPIVDADMMRRAFPEIQMVTATLYGVSATPMALADEKGNRALFETPDNFWTERLSRAVTHQMGGSACIALYAIQGKMAKQALIPGSLSLEREIGRTLREALRTKHDPIEALGKLVGARRLATGKISDLRRRTERGWARGEVEISGTQQDSGARFKIAFQNENLVFWRDGQIVVTVPDLITVVDEQTGTPITTETLKYGLRVSVLGIPCHEKWRTSAAIDLVGPRYFGYDVDYVPFESSFV